MPDWETARTSVRVPEDKFNATFTEPFGVAFTTTTPVSSSEPTVRWALPVSVTSAMVELPIKAASEFWTKGKAEAEVFCWAVCCATSGLEIRIADKTRTMHALGWGIECRLRLSSTFWVLSKNAPGSASKVINSVSSASHDFFVVFRIVLPPRVGAKWHGNQSNRSLCRVPVRNRAVSWSETAVRRATQSDECSGYSLS